MPRMTIFARATRQLALLAPIALLSVHPVLAQEIVVPVSTPAPAPAPTALPVSYTHLTLPTKA